LRSRERPILRPAQREKREGPMAIEKQSYPDVAMLRAGLEQLDAALRRPSAIPHAVIAVEFDRLEELVAALPLMTDEYCFAANWIAGARECWAAGEGGAAGYQLEMVRKKLAR
jgi:hypothetical protein